jgi:hypothetical protein
VDCLCRRGFVRCMYHQILHEGTTKEETKPVQPSIQYWIGSNQSIVSGPYSSEESALSAAQQTIESHRNNYTEMFVFKKIAVARRTSVVEKLA